MLKSILEELVRDRVNSALGYAPQDYADEAIAHAQAEIMKCVMSELEIEKFLMDYQEAGHQLGATKPLAKAIRAEQLKRLGE